MDRPKRIAVVCANNVEDMELIVPVDIWRRAQYIVDIIVYDNKSNFTMNYSQLKVHSNFLIKGTNLIQYDAIYLPGGPGAKTFLSPSSIEKDEPESKLHSALKKFFDDEKKWIIALCGAPIYLLCILGKEKTEDLKFTAYNNPELIGDFKNNWLNKKIVVDKRVITGQNAGCSYDIAFATIEILSGLEVAKELAKKLLQDYPGIGEYKFIKS